jgi:hypothetical protein
MSVLWDADAPVAPGGKARSAELDGITCPTGGDCVAYGDDLDSSGTVYRPLLETRHAGTWIPTAVSLPDGAHPWKQSSTGVAAVSCVQANCLDVAVYQDTRQVLHFFSDSSASRYRVPAELPIVGAAERSNDLAAGRDQRGYVSLSCWTTTACLAGVTIDFDDGGMFQHDAIELLSFNGQTWTPLPDPQLRFSTTKIGVEIDQVSCSLSGLCAVVGDASDSLGTQSVAWSAVRSGSTWTTSIDRHLESYDSVTCLTDVACRAVAETPHSTSETSLTADGTTTKWDVRGVSGTASDCSETICAFSGSTNQDDGLVGGFTRTAAMSTRGAPRGSLFDLGEPGSVACRTSTCVAVGGYERNTNTDNSAPAVNTFHNGHWVMSKVPLPVGAKRGVLNAVACTSASDCVATGQLDVSVTP